MSEEGHVWADELIETDEGILCPRFKGVICHWDPHMCDLDCPHDKLESVKEWGVSTEGFL